MFIWHIRDSDYKCEKYSKIYLIVNLDLDSFTARNCFKVLNVFRTVFKAFYSCFLVF